MKIKKMIEKIVDNDVEKDMDCLSAMLEDLVCDLRYSEYEKFMKYKFKLHKLAYGNSLCDEQAEHWVGNMKNASKKEVVGEHWTKQQTTEVMNKMGYSCDHNTFYIAMNYMYAKYYGIVSDNPETYAKMAYVWIRDELSVDDNLIKYYYYIVE